VNCGYCKDCKWWITTGEWRYERHGLGTCELVNPLEEITDTSGIMACGDGYDASGSFHTKPDFGCVQFEAK
jgi:hypothetical protein